MRISGLEPYADEIVNNLKKGGRDTCRKFQILVFFVRLLLINSTTLAVWTEFGVQHQVAECNCGFVTCKMK